MAEGDLRAAVAAGVLGAEELYAQLLRSVVEVARAIFGAKASSVFLLDEATDELVFAAVAGEGEEHLVGRDEVLGQLEVAVGDACSAVEIVGPVGAGTESAAVGRRRSPRLGGLP